MYIAPSNQLEQRQYKIEKLKGQITIKWIVRIMQRTELSWSFGLHGFEMHKFLGRFYCTEYLLF